ncbi:hypothetical protein EJP02_532 [Escherichia phage EJP2]|nr:hypothetical protein EJP02_532 [Escherichia phage EJP2]
MMHILTLTLNHKTYETILVISESQEKVRDHAAKVMQAFSERYPTWDRDYSMLHIADGNAIMVQDVPNHGAESVLVLF